MSRALLLVLDHRLEDPILLQDQLYPQLEVLYLELLLLQLLLVRAAPFKGAFAVLNHINYSLVVLHQAVDGLVVLVVLDDRDVPDLLLERLDIAVLGVGSLEFSQHSFQEGH